METGTGQRLISHYTTDVEEYLELAQKLARFIY